MVFALVSPEAGINLPSRRTCETRSPDNFTSYDIWCAGLLTESLQLLGDDLDAYRNLLDRSQRSHDAFDVSKPFYPPGEGTKIAMGRTRRGMAPLVKFRGHDEIHHIPG